MNKIKHSGFKQWKGPRNKNSDHESDDENDTSAKYGDDGYNLFVIHKLYSRFV